MTTHGESDKRDEHAPHGDAPDAASSPVSNSAVLVAILLVAAALRLITLSATPLWTDEIYTLWFQQQSIGFLWAEMPAMETHPPVYYAALSVLLPNDPSPFLLRLPSVAAGLVTVFLAYAIARRIWPLSVAGRNIALIAAAATAAHAFLIDMQQIARMYSFLIMFYALMLYIVIRLQELIFDPATQPGALNALKRGWLWAALLGMVAAVAQLTQSTAVFFTVSACTVLAGRGAAALVFGDSAEAKQRGLGALSLLSLSVIASALVFAPYLPKFLFQAQNLSENFWIPKPDLDRLVGLAAKIFGAPRLFSMTATTKILYSAGAAALMALCAVSLVFRFAPRNFSRAPGPEREEQWSLAIIAVGAALPFALMLAVSLALRPILLPQTISPVAVPACIIIAYAIAAFPAPRWRNAVLALALGGLAIGGAHFVIASPPYEDYETMMEKMRAATRPDTTAIVVTHPPFQDEVITYAARRVAWDVAVVSAAGPFPVRLKENGEPLAIGEPMPMTQTMAERAAGQTAEQDCVWLIFRSEEMMDEAGHLRNRIGQGRDVYRLNDMSVPANHAVLLAARSAARCVSDRTALEPI